MRAESSKKILVTSPGKIGDTLFQLPVARAVAEKYGKRVDFYTDRSNLKIKDLLSSCPFISTVIFSRGYSDNYGWGGQPWEMRLENDMKYDEIYHLGYDPYNSMGPNITDWSNKWELEIDKDRPCIDIKDPIETNEVIVHLATGRWVGGPWDYSLLDWNKILKAVERYHSVVLTGTKKDYKFYLFQSKTGEFNFKAMSFYETAQRLAGGATFLGINSSIAALANQIKCRSLVVHADSGKATSWHNYGPEQHNVISNNTDAVISEIESILQHGNVR